MTGRVARASGGAPPPGHKQPYSCHPRPPLLCSKGGLSLLRGEKEGRQHSCSPCPLVTPALLHPRAGACRSARRASVPASGTWRRPRGKATKPCCQPSFPSPGKGPSPLGGGSFSFPRRGRKGRRPHRWARASRLQRMRWWRIRRAAAWAPRSHNTRRPAVSAINAQAASTTPPATTGGARAAAASGHCGTPAGKGVVLWFAYGGRYGRQRCGLWGATTHAARSYPPPPDANNSTAPQATAGVRRARATTLRSARL